LGLGIFLAVITLAGFLESALIHQPVFVWSFFFGLVLASVVVVSKRVKNWNLTAVLLTIAATFSAYILVGLVPLQTPDTWWFWMLSGALASVALILPGISGAFILVLLGKYQETLSTVNALRSGDFSDVWVIFCLAFGAAIGLILFSRVLSWLFHHHHDYTVAVLIGLMIGSLRKIWPWKQDLDWLIDAVTGAYVLDSEGLRVVTKQINIPPDLSTPEGVTQFVIAIVLMLIGMVAVVLLDRVANKKEEELESAIPAEAD
jgi:putative membrane protein